MRKKQISIAMLIIMAYAMALPVIAKVQASPQTMLEISPETTIAEVGETFTVDVNIVDVVDLAGYKFKLGYDPNILEVVDATPGTLLDGASISLDGVYTGVPTVWNGYDCDVVPDGVLDICDALAIRCALDSVPGDPNWNPRADIDQNGVVNIADAVFFRNVFTLTFMEMPGKIFSMWWMNAPPPFSGSGSLVTITFQAIGFGVTAIDLYDTKLCLLCGGPIPHEARDGTVVVSPKEAPQYLITTIESWTLPKGPEKSLTGKLEDVIRMCNKDNLNGAVHKLGDFIIQVERLRERGELTGDQADYLIACAQAIINALV